MIKKPVYLISLLFIILISFKYEFSVCFAEANTLEQLKPNSVDKVADMKDVLAVLNLVYGGSQTMSEESNFPLQQKLVLCSLILILNKGKNKDVTVAKVIDFFN